MYLNLQSLQFAKLLYFMIFAFFLVNLLIVDLLLIKNVNLLNFGNEVVKTQSFDVNKLKVQQELIKQSSTDNDKCQTNCSPQNNLATYSSELLKPTITITPTKPTQTLTNSSVKEFFIPFGSGSNSTDDWADVSGLQVYVDSLQYSQIKKIVFEASVHIPTGNEKAYVRLFNKTDQHPVWFSEVSMEGGAPQLLISNPITLDSGNKLYQVQMKTSLKYQAILDQSRIHITIY
ncbi:MAG: hypothetical protein M1308_00050 [Actinobacteria bacterium]|nr:hypothetical protein [Actinomycetota bacterium]